MAATSLDWQPLIEFVVYAAIGVLSFLVWWFVYDRVLTRGYPLRDAIFGRQPNVAVALDVAGGFLAMGILNYAVISGPRLSSFARDVEALTLELLGTLVLLALLRMAIGAGLRGWFGTQRDAQGDRVSINNELFRQRNVATGLFSTALYLILVAGLVELDLLNLTGEGLASTWNLLGVWLLGAVAVLLHSWLFLGLGWRRHILSESFIRNNPAAPCSLLGLVGGLLLLNHALLAQLEPGLHMFVLPQLWYFLALGFVSLFVLRAILYALLRGLLGVDIHAELLQRHNAAWGVLDGAVVFSLFLILIALIA